MQLTTETTTEEKTEKTTKETIEALIKRFSLEPERYKRYSYPRLTHIAEIPTIIVDPHNEVLPFWYSKGSPPATVIHIDRHPDTRDKPASLESLQEQPYMDAVLYAKYFQSEGTFMLPAIFYDLVSHVYWINPKENDVVQFGKGRRQNNNLKSLVEEADGKLFWDVHYYPRHPPAETLSFEQMASDIDPDKPLILDIDLDAFECIEDSDFHLKYLLSLGTYSFLRKSFGISKRFEVLSQLKQLPRPERITIARSQTPIRYTPKSKVEYIEARVLDELRKLYEN
jgi:hypothetical protein